MKDMEFEFCAELSDGDRDTCKQFYASLQNKTLEQYPDWPKMEHSGATYTYFVARQGDKPVCTAIIAENSVALFPFAQIQFGPLFQDTEYLLASLKQIVAHFKKRKYMLLTMQLAFPAGNKADYIGYQLNKEFKIRSFYDRNNWSSLQLDLGGTEDEIFSNFSKGHKSDIKKAVKNQITVRESYSQGDWNDLLQIFEKMNVRRGLSAETPALLKLLEDVRKYFEASNSGKVFIVSDASGKVLGGILLAVQGKEVRYFKGASDPDQRQMPVLHPAIWEGIKWAKANAYSHFDFWGYNHFVRENDQVFHINRFKKGFGGDYSFYPPKMYFVFSPWKYRLYRFLKKLRTTFKR